VPRNRMMASCCFVLLVLTIPASFAQAADPSESLLPATTKGFISITNMDQLSEQWGKTQLGKLVNDPVMKPFADDLRRQLADRLWNLRRRLGLTLADLSGVPGGELSVAVVALAEEQTAVVILVDVTDHEEEAQALLRKVAKNMADEGAKGTATKVSGAPALRFVLPKTGKDKDQPPQQTIYVLKDNLLVGSDDLDVIEGVLARLADSGDDALADVPAFRAVMDRCQKDAGESTPQVRWFLEPFGYGRTIRAARLERDPARGKTLLEQLEATGFTAVQGVGGFVDFAVDRYDLVHRTAIYAPKPYEKSMKMLVFPNTADSKPPSWVPRDVATYTTFDCDALNAFDNFGPLFDEMAAEGEEGVWIDDVLPSLKTDPKGPQIDLREELFAQLDNRAIVITDYELPITTASERLLIAVKTKDAKAVAKALEKTMKNDEEIRRRVFERHVIWEVIPKEKVEVQKVELEAPPLGTEPEEEEDEQKASLLPNAAVTVAQGWLMIASHYDFLIKVLRPVDERLALERSIDYLIVEDAINRSGPGDTCLRGFSRTDEEYRPTYELMRQGKMPESETILGRILNAILVPDQKGAVRKSQIDASKAPDFEFVRHHLGRAGLSATSEDDGWFLKGFTLGKEAE